MHFLNFRSAVPVGSTGRVQHPVVLDGVADGRPAEEDERTGFLLVFVLVRHSRADGDMQLKAFAPAIWKNELLLWDERVR